METPSSSTRRVTRSQTLAASGNNSSNLRLPRKMEESEKTRTAKSRQRSTQKQWEDRSALVDITNDSPIVGLAMGNLKTPSSAMSKKKRMSSQGQLARTPGSGEALLRGQVKTLLQKVEEEAKLVTNRPFFINLQGLLNSPVNLVAPTPANTPQILNLDVSCLPCVDGSDNEHLIPQMMSGMLDEKKKKEGGTESENPITRSLLLDFSEKSSDSSSSVCSSVLTYQGAICCGDAESSRDDDDASVWSIQVNASSTGDGEEEEWNDFGDINDDGLLDELCEGISKMSVDGFMGKHIRFVYSSDDDDEIEGSEKVFVSESCSPTTSGGGAAFERLAESQTKACSISSLT
ncbi:hypothetical protein PHJA_002649200 [Phtheirospermum japonicum]|uniref:Uncharacterized protein n=1 Tax=Phtheirospermum japonicum TaxID=374723 RepID=A0A830CYP7_9LAMI|nr:hypothetical protein PHJA_002649200 [Phtheirospermum japonicum]